jgi:hypothetical protein
LRASIRNFGFRIAAFFFLVALCAHADPLSQWPGITVTTETRTNPALKLFIAQVDLTNPAVHVRVAPGGPDPDGPGKWQTTLMEPTRIAAREGFALVVNGDFFDVPGVADGEGTNSHYHLGQRASVEGRAVTDGNVWSTGRPDRPCLVVHKDRSVAIESVPHPSPDDFEVISGNTILVKNGAVVSHLSPLRHPRTIVGLDAAHTKLFIVVVDGRSAASIGMSYNEEAAEMLKLGCAEALNLDGGGSSVMAMRESTTDSYQTLNVPSDGHERSVANALGVTVDVTNSAPAH